MTVPGQPDEVLSGVELAALVRRVFAPRPADTGRWQGTTAGLTTAVPTTIAVGASRTLCVWQSLGTNTPDGTQGQTASVTVTVTGTQTAP